MSLASGRRKPVCVAIPVYRSFLTAHESVALSQCMRVLHQHPIVLVKPSSLDASYLTGLYPQLQIREFDAAYFQSVRTYNKLMLSEHFYEAFSDFEFVLIYQLDAFVFRDELLDWCERGYDYVGAPWLLSREFTGWWDERLFGTRKKLAAWFHLKNEDGVTPRDVIYCNSVGNGGFSLRRVSALRKVISLFSKKIATYERMHHHRYNEDVFFGIEVNRYFPFLRIPDFRTALQFSVETYPERAIGQYNSGRLPSGCHGWNVHGTDYWRRVFSSLGYQI
jgi:hypothetical protein